MKKLFLSTKISLIALLWVTTLSARPVAQVAEVKGNAFVGTEKGMTALTKGSYIQDLSEVFTETGSSLVIEDFDNHRYNLSNQGHLKFMNKMVELKSGYLWIQSQNSQVTYSVQTADAQINFGAGESIISFDEAQGKSQVLVIKGEVDFFNHLLGDPVVSVREGRFSFIEREFNQGVPRDETPIGESSFKKVLSLFPGTKPISGEIHLSSPPPSRAVASIAMEGENFDVRTLPELKKDGVISSKSIKVLNKEKVKIGDVDTATFLAGELEAANKIVVKKKDPFAKKSGVAIYVFGKGLAAKTKPEGTRAPASVRTESSPTVENTSHQNSFELDQYKKTMRHDNETDGLLNEISDLKE